MSSEKNHESSGTAKTILVTLISLGVASVIVLFVARFSFVVGQVIVIQEYNDTVHNLVHIYPRLEDYNKEHGSYPEQQDMNSLLKTLGMRDKDLKKTRFVDFYSAIYYAPVEDAEDELPNPDDPLITIRVKSRVFGECRLLYLRKNGTVYNKILEKEAGLENSIQDRNIILGKP